MMSVPVVLLTGPTGTSFSERMVAIQKHKYWITSVPVPVIVRVVTATAHLTDA